MTSVATRGSEEAGAAYAHCERLTRRQAANFYWGIRLLPAERRRAMSAVYAFARRIDDIGDGTLGSDEKRRRLDEESAALQRLAADGELAGDLVLIALSDARRRFPLPLDALEELIEGVRMDVEGTRYESFEGTVLYCRRVAGTIGRLCLAIFGLRAASDAERGRATALADDLGVALQLTNILRDVREDALGGRVYLPLEDLRRFGLLTDGAPEPHRALLAAVEGAGEEVSAMMRFEAGRAGEWFERGLALAPLLDRRSAACLLAMAGIYRRVLARIEADPATALRARVSLRTREKAWVALRGVLARRA